jgi:hypothetical protein
MDIINTRENLIEITKIRNHAAQVHFKFGSDDFKKYGQYVTVQHVIDRNEELLMNHLKNKFTSGQITCSVLGEPITNPELIITFDTNNIMEIQGQF